MDVDKNGQYDSAIDRPLAGVLLSLSGTDVTGASAFGMVSSGTDGTYSFTSLAASDASGYTITQGDVTGYTQGAATPGNPVNGTIGTSSDVISQIHFGAGTNLVGYNFSEFGGSLHGITYVDVNNSGTPRLWGIRRWPAS